jgi:hypothetical protein
MEEQDRKQREKKKEKENLDDKIFGKISKAKVIKKTEDKNENNNKENKEIKEKKESTLNKNLFKSTSINTNDTNNFFPNKEQIIKEKENKNNNLKNLAILKALNVNTAIDNFNFKKNINDNPQTTMNKVVFIMKKVKDKLNEYKEFELIKDIDWVTKEIVTNNIYNLKIEENKEKEEIDFFDEFSNMRSEKMFNNDIIKSGNFYLFFFIFSLFFYIIFQIYLFFFRKSNTF